MARYPYKSKLKRQLAKSRAEYDYLIWNSKNFDFDTALNRTSGELVELGGPSFGGFYFLDDTELPRKLTITNISDKPFQFKDWSIRANKHISRYIDATNLPYDDNSLGLILVRFLSYGPDIEPHSRTSHDKDEWKRGIIEMIEIYLGIRSLAQAKLAQRVKMLLEAYRTLEPGGILITDGEMYELEIMKKVGFEPKSIIYSIDMSGMEEVVLQKPA